MTLENRVSYTYVYMYICIYVHCGFDVFDVFTFYAYTRAYKPKMAIPSRRFYTRF